MKLPELRSKFRNKYAIRIVAGVLTIALLGSGMTAAAVQADQKNGAETKTEHTLETDGDKTDTADDLKLDDMVEVSANDEEIGKEESVYLFSDASGKVHDTLVSDHLINKDKADRIEDQSSLSDIENVKGDETFSQNGEKLTWQADGNDIYYQGKSKEEAPVSQKVTYYLDGNEISPEELAGKSGKVTIHFDYTNNSTYNEVVNGEEQTVKVPFAAVTAMVLDDSFTNIEVKNGKVSANGNNTIVMGYALPGIKDSLGITDSDFIEEMNLPEDFEVTADVTDFKLETAMTIVANAGQMVSLEKKEDASSLDTMIDDLLDASSQLKDGSHDLAKGMDTLQSNLADYASGMSQLNSKSGDLGKGVTTLNTSASSLNKGIQKLDKALNTKMSNSEKESAVNQASAAVRKEFKKGKTKEVADQIYASLRYTVNKDGSKSDGALYTSLYDGAYSANAAEAVYSEVVRQVLLQAAGQPADSQLSADQAAAGIEAGFEKGAQANDPAAAAMYAVSSGMTSAQLAELLYAKSGAKDTLFSKTESTIQAQIQAGRTNEKVASGVEDSLKKMAAQLAGACQSAAEQAAGQAAVSGAESAKATIAEQIEAVQSNGYSLVTGASALSKGTQKLSDSVPALTEGIKTLNDATTKIVSGVDELNEGSHDLADGMVEFDEEGISKIANSYKGDIKPLANKLQAALDAGKDYQTFTSIADGVNGSVKFIYKLDSVKTGDDK
ncbi:MAG: hypothetical protein PUF81_05850 [Lachnospiraceae bacterium]|nr:hypothetical protein [Lachnospiraceae bacterium]